MDPYYDSRGSPGRSIRSGNNPRLAQSYQPNQSFMPTSVRQFRSMDMMLGGEIFRTPQFTPKLAFSKAQKRTPESNEFVKVIPWDDKLKDFVYGIVNESDFDGKMHPLDLKQVSF